MRVQKGRRRSRSPALPAAFRAVLALALTLVVVAAGAPGCALGPDQEPGCRDHADCGEGFTCKAGACFLETGAPAPATDGGADASGDAG